MQCRAFIFFAIFLLFGVVENKRILKPKNFKCISLDRNLIIFKTCSIRAISRNISEMNLEISLIGKPIKQIKVFIELSKREDVGSLTIFNISYDLCEFMKDRPRYPIANLCYEIMALDRFSNMNHTCPYEGDLYIRNYRVDDTILSKIPFPSGDYKLKTLFYLQKQKAAKVEISVLYYEQIENGKRKTG